MKIQEQQTRIYKDYRNNWHGQTTRTEHGQTFDLSTSKNSRGQIVSIATKVEKTNDGAATITMFGMNDNFLSLNHGKKRATEKAVKEAHYKFLAAFDLKIQETDPKELKTEAPEVGDILFLDGYGKMKGSKENHKIIYSIDTDNWGTNYKCIEKDTLNLTTESHVKPISKKFGIGTYYEKGFNMGVFKINQDKLANMLIEAQELAKEKAEAQRIANEEAAKKAAKHAEYLSQFKQADRRKTTNIIKKHCLDNFNISKIEVKTEVFSGGDSMRVKYYGPEKIKELEGFINSFQYGHFNGMEDIYEHDPNRSEIILNGHILEDYKYVFCDWKQGEAPVKKESKNVEFIDFAAELLGSSNFEIVKTKHSKKGFDLWVVKVLIRVEKDEFKELLTTAKSLGGWYSSYKLAGAVPGFQFKTEQAANDFLNNQETTPAAGPVSPKKSAPINQVNANEKTAAKWQKLADSYQADSENKFNELKTARRNTPKQNREANSKRVDAEILQDAATMAAGIAQAYTAGTIAAELTALQPVKSKRHLFSFIPGHESAGYYDAHRAEKSCFEKNGIRFLNIPGIDTQEKGQKVFNLLQELTAVDPEEKEAREKENRINQLTEKFRFQKIAGFFPTPKNLGAQMLEHLKITNGQTICEPGAGLGDLAEVVKTSHPQNTLKTIEINPSLAEILTLKGFETTNDDFLNTSEKFDRFIMNPPFEKAQDIDHVKHAYSLLNEGGRLVSIMGAGAFQNSSNKHKAFQTWIDKIGADYFQLPADSFKNAFKSTGVNTYLIIIDK